MNHQDMPLISIIVPVYNVKKYLSKCIESIIRQTYKKLEIILVDDGSTDGCAMLCDQYAKTDKRIKVIHKENGGQATAKNVGLDVASGNYLGFVDSDDWIELEMYETMLLAAERHNADIVVCGRNNISDTGDFLGSLFVFPEEFSMNKVDAISRLFFNRGIDGSSCDKLYRAELLKGIRFPTEYICEDLLFIYYAFKASLKIVHVGKPLYNVYYRNGSTSRSPYSKKTLGMIVYTKEIRDDSISCFPELKQESEYFYFSWLYGYLGKVCNSNFKIDNIPNTKEILEIMHNCFLCKHVKIKFLLYYFRLFRPLRKMKRLIGEH